MSLVATLLGGVAVMVVGVSVADAHQCETVDGEEHCDDTDMAPNWRDPYVPLFTLEDHEDEEQRRDAQRWRDEWGCKNQHCAWLHNDTSIQDDGKPGGVHGGTAADHSMFEVAHDSEDHGDSESNHDAHGGAIYFDICLGSDEGTSYEGQAGECRSMEDSQVGVTLVDHNACGTVVPYVSCTDEYHIVRPLDAEYTDRQMENTQRDAAYMAEDPERYACGYGPGSEDCPVKAVTGAGD